jgi:hypothetical protein
VRILLDECVDQRFRKELAGHSVRTVQEAGWAGKKNGELLKLAAGAFDVFVTVDRNLYFQQNVTQLKIAVAILVSPTNRVVDLKVLVPTLLAKVAELKPGEIVLISKP